MRSASLFESDRLTLPESIALSADSLREYGARYRHWVFAYSGGKDSTSTVTLAARLVETGEIPRPESMTVLYADTCLELPPLQQAAFAVIDELRERGFEARIVQPELDDRFFVYLLGRGVPPPHNAFRWCTGIMKIKPMLGALTDIRQTTGAERLLLVTGMRLGESAARDRRIALSCGRNGGECGQGWFQETTPAEIADTLAPLLHWRVCHVGDWLSLEAPSYGFPTVPIVETYGAGAGDHEPLEARTGCMACPVAGRDIVLERLAQSERWAYIAPLLRLRSLYEDLTRAPNRLRKVGERLVDGRLSRQPMRMGPLTLEARRRGLEVVLTIQAEVNDVARARGLPEVHLIDETERARIEELIDAGVWPNGWNGDEVRGDALTPVVFGEGVVQSLLFGE
jgi:DNA sulfur modification protein DndC